jgi:hypothetical protein
VIAVIVTIALVMHVGRWLLTSSAVAKDRRALVAVALEDPRLDLGAPVRRKVTLGVAHGEL